jgi:hypothetical protein
VATEAGSAMATTLEALAAQAPPAQAGESAGVVA